ncbi:3-deoxy-manno-octulosonate cytidylyltransferase [Candidatus Kaiserbacteria bacterium]|nr:3-deoxy-manno-octulosonate cytidylyltransferase [Candidatus Kaiserbacteria bacterium]
MHIVGIIPARMGSSRFPGKPLAPILGMPMIGHCYFRTRMCDLLDEVYIATCDKEIKEYAESIGAKVVMTADTHERAMDRTAEAVTNIEKATGKKIDIVVQMQGDEPMVTKEMLESATRKMIDDPAINIMNLVSPIVDTRDLEIPDTLKVVTDLKGNMLYYSRACIPYDTKKYSGKVPYLKTLGIHLFRKDFLFEFSRMEPTPLEIIESTDMLRILENGLPIATFLTETQICAVDTKEDLELVEKKMKDDPLVETYASKK